jgi:hypothetical protein
MKISLGWRYTCIRVNKNPTCIGVPWNQKNSDLEAEAIGPTLTTGLERTIKGLGFWLVEGIFWNSRS